MPVSKFVWLLGLSLVSILASESTLAAQLSALQVSNGTTLTPAFQGTTFNYSATVPATRTSITITSTAALTTSTIRVNGITVASGVASPSIALSTGANTINVEVNGNGVGPSPGIDVYTLIVTRQAPDTSPPAVTFTSPAQGATLSGIVTVTATASDNVGVVGVQFKVDGGNVGSEDTIAPYTLTGNTADIPDGPHVLTAVARDAAGNQATTPALNFTVNNSGGGGDTTAPTVALTAPASGATVSGTVTVSANASDNVGVAGVQFKLDGNNLGAEDTATPYSTSWNTTGAPNGSHSLTVVARDAAGNQTTAATRTVTVSNLETTPPTISMTAPAAGSTVSGIVALGADAGDNVGVVGVQFSVDGNNLGAEDTSAPYSANWDTTAFANGSHAVTGVARDAAGNRATAAAITVTVSNADVTAPAVSLTAPANGASVSGTVAVSASASDNIGVVGVQFTVDGNNVGVEDSSAPYSFSWDTSTVTPGSHTLSAIARDAAGNQATATARDVTVTSAPPSSGHPNILLIVADDMGAEASELYPNLYDAANAAGRGQVSTPNIRALASRGIVYDNMWSNPVCSPTRAAMLSGLYGHNTGVTNVGNILPGSTTSIFEYIAASASGVHYNMATFGKWHLGGTGSAGIDHVVNQTGVPLYKGFLGGAVTNYYNWTVNSSSGPSANTTVYTTTALTNYAVDFIRNQSGTDPWFVYLPYGAPHGTSAYDGFQVPPANLFTVDVGGRLPGRSTVYNGVIPVYQAVIQAMDTEIGRLLGVLAERDQLENTLIIFVGDNGTPAPVKDVASKIRGSKEAVYEGSVRVPLVIAGPGVTRTGRESKITAVADLYATIAELANGAPLPLNPINNSFSLVPTFTSAQAGSGRNYSFTELCNNNGTGTKRFAIRDQRYKLLYNGTGWEMFDLETDPRETTNLYTNPSFAVVRGALLTQLSALKAQATTGGCFVTIPAQ